jgi:hypothetical protein
VGPYKVSDSTPQADPCLDPWAHMELLAAFVKLLNGPMQIQQQHFSGALMGPYKLAGSMFNMAAWAHTKIMAALVLQLPRPIQTSLQHVSGTVWAHAKITVALLDPGPMKDSCQ